MSNLPFPEKILHQHIATLGKTGSGKSSALRVIAEHLLDKQRRVAIVDPKGDWWGLKSSADGKSAGYPVIMFGDFKESRATDVPINDRSGKHVAELIASGNRPCVLGFRGWMPAQLVRFWLDFAPTMFNANQGELNVIIDEVQNFAPKGKIFDPDAGKCLHWTNRIMSEGRGLGLTFFIASQRPQKVHNDTLDNCETLIAMRVAHPAAREALKTWMEGNGDKTTSVEVLNTLAQLKRGEAWVWSPENNFGPERVQFPMFGTFDSFAPPQVQKKVSQASWAEVNLDQVREKLASVIAEQKANDPKELKAEIARLKQELSKKTVATKTETVTVADPKAVERAVKIATAPLLARIDSMRKQAQATIQAFTKAAGPLNEMANISAPEIPVLTQTPQPMPVRQPHHVPPPSRTASVPPSNGNGDGKLSGPESKIMRALAELLSIGKEVPTKDTVAAWAGYSPNGGAFTNPLGALRTRGLVDYPSAGLVSLTDEGRSIVGPQSPPSQEELWQRIEGTCSGPEQRILRALIDTAGQDELDKPTLAAKAGYSPDGGAFTNPLGALRTKGLLDYPRQGVVRAADWLFV